MTKIIGLANSCKDCPERHYFSGGAYECMKVQGSRLNDDSTIPTWCPLNEYPAASAPAVDAKAFEIALNALDEYQRNWDTGAHYTQAQTERVAMECAVEAVREELNEARAALSTPPAATLSTETVDKPVDRLTYTYAVGEAAQRYFDLKSGGNFKLPGQFFWVECFAAMVAEAAAGDKA